MAALSGSAIVHAIKDAFEQAGATALLINSTQANPRKFLVQAQTSVEEVWIYIWTLTFGGRKTLPDEYRIQMTSVTSPLSLNPKGRTLLLGYEPNLGMFAGFDLSRHRRFTTGSPSVQIDIKTLHKALIDGLAFDKKSNDEIAIGFRPDQILSYIENSDDIFALGRDANILRLLERATSSDLTSSKAVARIPEERRRIIIQVSKLSRDARFKKTVLSAYDHRCAVLRIQLKLVDAAHILPVATTGSLDIVTNGLALSPTMHRAYDFGLIYLDTDYRMKVNRNRIKELTQLGLDGGLSDFRTMVERPIHLPQDRGQWPDKDFIRSANQVRAVS